MRKEELTGHLTVFIFSSLQCTQFTIIIIIGLNENTAATRKSNQI